MRTNTSAPPRPATPEQPNGPGRHSAPADQVRWRPRCGARNPQPPPGRLRAPPGPIAGPDCWWLTPRRLTGARLRDHVLLVRIHLGACRRPVEQLGSARGFVAVDRLAI